MLRVGQQELGTGLRVRLYLLSASELGDRRVQLLQLGARYFGDSRRVLGIGQQELGTGYCQRALNIESLISF